MKENRHAADKDGADAALSAPGGGADNEGPSPVDIHCHCLPAIDDGPADLAAAVRLCEALIEDGFRAVVASPHQLGRHEGVITRDIILARLDSLRSELDRRGLELEVFPGADVRIDDRVASLVASGEVLTVADARRYLLLELPHSFYVEPTGVIESLARQGVVSVMTHPERYRYLNGAIEPVEAWRARGVVIQVTAGSLLGDFGRGAYAYGWRLVRSGLVDLIATDAHDAVNRRPRMRDAIERLEFEVGARETHRLCRLNPSRVLSGEPIARHSETPL